MANFPWLIPGAQSRQVTAVQSVASPGSAGTVTLVSYTVPEGMVFSLRGVTVGVIDPGGHWSEGSAQLTFSLLVTSAGGTRPVEYLSNLVNQLGSKSQPYPILGRTEFDENNVLQWVCVSDGTVTGANLFGHIIGFERPSLDCGDLAAAGASQVR